MPHHHQLLNLPWLVINIFTIAIITRGTAGGGGLGGREHGRGRGCSGGGREGGGHGGGRSTLSDDGYSRDVRDQLWEPSSWRWHGATSWDANGDAPAQTCILSHDYHHFHRK